VLEKGNKGWGEEGVIFVQWLTWIVVPERKLVLFTTKEGGIPEKDKQIKAGRYYKRQNGFLWQLLIFILFFQRQGSKLTFFCF